MEKPPAPNLKSTQYDAVLCKGIEAFFWGGWGVGGGGGGGGAVVEEI